ncbi:hemolysin family protein [Oceanibaculum nanhaiense]|uniref:hemolysin family protein n=1 Tax=Oceanibaculum nanhaiense TaxID=1909734 RepID=UPI00396E6A16
MLIWEMAFVGVLVLLNGFFAMSEMALVSSRRARLQQLAEEGSHNAAAALRLVDDPTRFLSTVQIGITLVGVFAGAYSGAAFAGPVSELLALTPLPAQYAYPVALTLVVICITYLSLIVGELVPKRLALAHAERIASLAARPMSLLANAAAPLVWLLRISTEAVLRLLGLHDMKGSPVSAEEIRTIIAEGREAGVLDQTEREMIDSVLGLGDRQVRGVMTPRYDVVWIHLMDDVETIRAKLKDSGHSRFPVSASGLDAVEGIVQAKDLLEMALRGEPISLRELVRPPLVVHERTSALKVLDLFRGQPVHMALVIDEYGGFEGLVTPTDILTAIAGELPEQSGVIPEAVVRRPDGSWLLDGAISIQEAERILGRGAVPPSESYQTLAGFMLWELGHLPATGEVLECNGWSFEVVDMDGRRIDRILASRATSAAGPN